MLLLGLALFLGGWCLRGTLEKTTEQPRVIGIGGIFFKCKDPVAVRAWYGKHFGIMKRV